ncbi:hypothetical protein [Parashewanella tropica]|uniref:hypothetical protein n=1 Tax=Parashewanella tropica TaxID=2547970 RepID=UPI00105A3E76|nr:hypothetical protein [Parashewanella tropica]
MANYKKIAFKDFSIQYHPVLKSIIPSSRFFPKEPVPIDILTTQQLQLILDSMPVPVCKHSHELLIDMPLLTLLKHHPKHHELFIHLLLIDDPESTVETLAITKLALQSPEFKHTGHKLHQRHRHAKSENRHTLSKKQLSQLAQLSPSALRT